MTPDQAQQLLIDIDQIIQLLATFAGFLCFCHGFNSGYQR